MISVIIPCRNEEHYIAECIRSTVASLSSFNFEILVCDGCSTDGTREIVEELARQDARIKRVPNPAKYAPHGMNAGLEASRGDYIFIISAHATYPQDYFSTLVNAAVELQADCTGGLLRVDAKARTRTSCAIIKVLSDPLGVGNALFRIGAQHCQKVDTVPFGCYPRHAFDRYGKYDTRLIRNQDLELNRRIANAGGSIYLVPSTQATYFARTTFVALAGNNFGNGKWNVLTANYTRTLRSLSLRHFIPLAFLLSLAIPVLLSFAWQPCMWVAIASATSYLAAITFRSWRLTDESTSPVHLMAAFLCLHLSYGIGSAVGLFHSLIPGPPRSS